MCFFKGTDNNNETLDHVLQFKGETKKVNNKILKFILQILADNGSSFDSYVVLNNLFQRGTVFSSIKDGSGISSPRIFNGYVDKNKKIPQYVHFRHRRVHINISLKKKCISF